MSGSSDKFARSQGVFQRAVKNKPMGEKAKAYPKQLKKCIHELAAVMVANDHPVPFQYAGCKDVLAVMILDTRPAYTKKVEEAQTIALKMGRTHPVFDEWAEFELMALQFADTLPETAE